MSYSETLRFAQGDTISNLPCTHPAFEPRSGGCVNHQNDGFTLLEVILAVGLTTLLMAALYTAMSVYWTTATESYDEISPVS